jgi:hypothetical protein
MKAKNHQNLDEDLEIIVVKSLEEIEDIRSIWEEMQSNEPYPIINADIDRYISVIKALDGEAEPYVMLFKRAAHPEMLIVSRIEKRQLKLKFGYKTVFSPTLRCLTVSHGGIIGQRTSDLYALLIRELMKVLRRREVDVVYFNYIRTDSHIYQLFRKLPGVLTRSYFPRIQPHWQTHVPDTAEEFYASISRKRKKEWKRLSKKLEQVAGRPLEVKCYDQESQLDHFIKVASMISAMTYKKALNAEFSDTSLTRSLLIQAARSGWWRAYILYAGEVPCAFETGIIYGRTYFAEAIGYNPEWGSFSPGTILFVKVLEDLSQNTTVNIFDYGVGSAAYKERFGTESWPKASIYIFAPRFYPVCINILRTLILGLNSAFEYVLNKTGSVGWIKRRWRNRLQKDSER